MIGKTAAAAASGGATAGTTFPSVVKMRLLESELLHTVELVGLETKDGVVNKLAAYLKAAKNAKLVTKFMERYAPTVVVQKPLKKRAEQVFDSLVSM